VVIYIIEILVVIGIPLYLRVDFFRCNNNGLDLVVMVKYVFCINSFNKLLKSFVVSILFSSFVSE
jgi:hypothetical protein